MRFNYIGTKKVVGVPMTHGEFCEVHDKDPLPRVAEEDPGYEVTYENRYVSWSPKAVFEKSYRKDGEFDFGMAIMLLKLGYKMQRKGWNGKGMWLILVPGSTGIRPVAGTPYSNAGLIENVDINPHIDMYTADGAMQPGWLASQTDMLAEDWQIAY